MVKFLFCAVLFEKQIVNFSLKYQVRVFSIIIQVSDTLLNKRNDGQFDISDPGIPSY